MRSRNWVLLLLLIPFIAVLFPSFYSGIKPTLAGIPFFIWYQFAWAIITAILTAVVYLVQTAGRTEEESEAEIRAQAEER